MHKRESFTENGRYNSGILKYNLLTIEWKKRRKKIVKYVNPGLKTIPKDN